MFTDRQYCEVWTCLLQWTEKQIKRKNSFIIPHFGLIKYDDNLPKSKRKFYIISSLITQQNAKLATSSDIDLISINDLNNSSAIKCHISSLAKYSPSLSESQLQVGLKHIFSKLFEQIGRSTISTKNYHDIDNFQRHLKIIINFGFGYFACSEGICDFIFQINEPLIINPSIPKGLKNIPNKYLKSTSSLLSVTSIPSNIKTINNKQDKKQEINVNEFEIYKEKYSLPLNNDYDNPLIYLSSTDTIKKVCFLCYIFDMS